MITVEGSHGLQEVLKANRFPHSFQELTEKGATPQVYWEVSKEEDSISMTFPGHSTQESDFDGKGSDLLFGEWAIHLVHDRTR